MTSTVLVKDLLYQVSTQLHDMAPQFTRWTEKELVGWLNDGQRAIAKYMPSSCSRVDVVKLVPGTKQSIDLIPLARILPGDGSAPANVYGISLLDVRRNMGVNGLTPGDVIRVVDMEILDSIYPNWHTKSGQPSQYAFKPVTPTTFYVSPGVPSVGAVWVELSLIALPTPIVSNGSLGFGGSSTVTISVADTYADDLINYILARAYMKDAEFAANSNLAAAHTTLFTSSINAQTAALTGVSANLQSLPLNPNLARSG